MDVSERDVHFSSMPYGDISADCGNVDHIIRLGLEPMEIHLATGGGNITGGMGGGTGKLQLKTGAHPGAMKDAVCSPGGTTIRGVAALERGGLRAAVINAVDAAEYC